MRPHRRNAMSILLPSQVKREPARKIHHQSSVNSLDVLLELHENIFLLAANLPKDNLRYVLHNIGVLAEKLYDNLSDTEYDAMRLLVIDTLLSLSIPPELINEEHTPLFLNVPSYNDMRH